MDKRITLKKPKNKRVLKDDIPLLNLYDTMSYLNHYFIENILLDNNIFNKFTSEIKKKIDSYKRQDQKKNRYDNSIL